MLEVNPDAPEIARALDKERAENVVHSPMHGIPVLLRDNIATGNQLHIASGAAAMLAWDPEESTSNHVALTSIDQPLLAGLFCRLMSA